TGALNPCAGIAVNTYATPALGDVNGDGTPDLVLGDATSNLRYFQNTGTAASPAYTQQTGAANPFDGINSGGSSESAPALGDVNGDGPLVLVLGHPAR